MSLPLLLPAKRNVAIDLMMPNTSCERSVVTFPWDGSGRIRVRREPDAATICCSLVPENWPNTAWVMDVGGWMVSEYKNIFDVVAMFHVVAQKACAAAVYDGISLQSAWISCGLEFEIAV